MSWIIAVGLNILSPWLMSLIAGAKAGFSINLLLPTELLKELFANISFTRLFFAASDKPGEFIPEVGLFPWWQLPFYILGFYFLFSELNKRASWLLTAIIISGLFASFFKQSGSLINQIPLLFCLSLVTSLGFHHSLLWLKQKKRISQVLIIVFFIFFIFYNEWFIIHQLLIHYPKLLNQS